MPRTNTTSEAEIPRGDVTFGFSQGKQSHITVITLPPASKWSAGPHWHETHTEYLRVRTGTARVRIGSMERTLSAEGGPVEIPRGIIHDWARHPSGDGVLVVEEWTEPADGDKELFFRNLFSAIRDTVSEPPAASPPMGIRQLIPLGWWIELQVMVISAGHDNYPLLWEGSSGAILSRPCLVLLASLGRLLGLQASYPEYTPARSFDKKEI